MTNEQDKEARRLIGLAALDGEARLRAPIVHAPWPTGVPPVCTGYWDQAAWDRFAEGYRPKGYTGGIHDDRAYLIWKARRCVEEGRQGSGDPWSIPAAELRDALKAADVCRESRRGDYCEVGTCFVCTVHRVYYKREE